MRDEISHQPVYLCREKAAPLRGKRTFNHFSCPASDHVASLSVGDTGKTEIIQNAIEGSDKIGCSIDQRAVEIEYDDGSEHGTHR